jgi:O-antigen/teichoic acid export membrane protein
MPILLARILPPDRYGVYKIVTGAMTVVNALLVTGAVQSVSKFVAEDRDRSGEVHRKAILLQGGLGIAAAILFVLAAPLLAAGFRDPGLTWLLRIAALPIATFGLYAVFMGTVNGRGQFGRQAALDFTYSTAKAGLILAFAWKWGVPGALIGFACAGLAAGLLGTLVAGTGRAGATFPMGRLLGFAAGAMTVTLVINLLLQTDLFLVKRLSPPETSNLRAGLYSAALDLSRLPYQAVAVPAALVLLPAVSRGIAAGDRAGAADALRRALRYVLIGVGLCATILSANAGPLLLLVFGPRYAGAVEVLRVVPFGVLGFCVFYLYASALIGSGRPLQAAALGAATLILDVALNTLLIPRYALLGAAAATSIALALGAALAGIGARRWLGAGFPAVTAVRVLVAAGMTAAAAASWSTAGPAALAECALLAVLFAAILVACGEISRRELGALSAALRHARARPG